MIVPPVHILSTANPYDAARSATLQSLNSCERRRVLVVRVPYITYTARLV